MIKKRKKSKRGITIFWRILSVILTISFILFSSILIKLNILPSKYLTLFIIFFSVLTIIYDFILSKQKFKKSLKIFSIAFSLINALIFSLGFFYLNKTNNFMSSLKQVNYVTEEYYLLVNKESNYKKISDLDNLEIYTFNEKIDIYDNAIKKLKSLTSAKIVESDSAQSICDKLINNKIDAIMLSSVHKTSMDEDLEDFKTSVKVLHKINIKIKKSDKKAHPDIDVSKQPFVIYISGADSYGNIEARSRSDVNMIATINPNTYEVLLTSIPRDYYVQLHNTEGSKDKLTHAGIYGVDMSINTISDFLNINIDYYFKVNFSTLVKIVDSIDGVDVYSDQEFTPWTNNTIRIKKGINHMNGEMAIAFARERKSYNEGDRHRIQNQQDVLSAIVKKVSSSTVLLTKYSTLLDSLSSCFDTNFGKNEITKLVKLQINDMPNWSIKTYNLNGSDSHNVTYSGGTQELYVMNPDINTVNLANKYINGIKSGKTFIELGIN